MTQTIDWDNLPFGLNPADTMFLNHCQLDGSWQQGEFVPFGPISLSPASNILNYGQGIFEGLKAYRHQNNHVVLFRPEHNAQRFKDGAISLSMPPYPTTHFVDTIIELVNRNQNYVPPFGKGTLYIRPCLWGTGAGLGIKPANEYTFAIYCSCVGNHYNKKSADSLLPSIKLSVASHLSRSAPHGTGHIKYIGNYAPGLKQTQTAKAEGYAGLLFLDACQERYIEEVGTSNFFCVIDDKLVTPQLGTILPGITRDSIITLARELLGLTVEERKLDIAELAKASECFCCGTAVGITPIESIQYQEQQFNFENNHPGPITLELYQALIGIQLGQREDLYNWITHVS